MRLRPEILAPAGTREAMKAAVANGADAVYFGLEQFNARIRAENFTLRDLPDTMAYLHEHGVKGYITMNTLIFPAELETAREVLLGCSRAGVDALLVQDIGIARLAHAIVPELPIHASTQMTITGPEGIAALDALGLDLERIVAAREMNRKELRKTRAATEKEIEVFVHGAICVAYSGQCLTSEALGGRSANRGECAQACRLPYDLIVDGEPQDLDDVKYLLSPKDLSAYEDIGDLIEMGIVSLKIEGRLKTPEYVAATVQSYRKAVDEAMADQEPTLDRDTEVKLAMTFSRGFTGGYLHDTNHQVVVEGRFPKKRGLYLGKVTRVHPNHIDVYTEGPLKPGDGVVFDSGKPGEKEQGGRVYHIRLGRHQLTEFDPIVSGPSEVSLEFGRDHLDTRKVQVGDLLWKTSDPKLDGELQASYEEEKLHYRRPVDARVTGKPGIPLKLSLNDDLGNSITVEDTEPADLAEKRPLDETVLRKQLGRLGQSPLTLRNLTLHLDGDIMVPMSRLNDLRRRAVEVLLAKRRERGTTRNVEPERFVELMREPQELSTGDTSDRSPKLSVLCRELAQVEAAAAHPDVDTIYTDFEDIKHHKEARKLITDSRIRFAPATIRVVKPGEAPFIRTLLKADPDAILVRSLSAWEILRHEAPELELRGDYSLNVANQLSAALLYRHGIKTQTPSYDLNIDQLLDLLREAPAHWFEITVHQYMPMFYMEHCVFCRFMSNGTDFTNCGRPCEEHQIAVRDRMGYAHPVKADAGCRNTVYNAIPQSASAYIRQLREVGTHRYRIDFLAETPAQVTKIIDAYGPVVRGDSEGSSLWRDLRVESKLGVTKGSLDHGRV